MSYDSYVTVWRFKHHTQGRLYHCDRAVFGGTSSKRCRSVLLSNNCWAIPNALAPKPFFSTRARTYLLGNPKPYIFPKGDMISMEGDVQVVASHCFVFSIFSPASSSIIVRCIGP